MASARRVPLLLVAALALVATGLGTHYATSSNPSVLPSGLGVTMNAESTALYCTGLASATHPGRVDFYNSASASRSLEVTIVSDRGDTYVTTLELAAHASASLVPSALAKGDNFGVAAQVSGGGVLGEEIAGSNRAEAPCVATGVRHWYATGFDTLVGSSAYLSLYNPTATNAVLNVTLYSSAGVAEPDAFQGISVRAHSETQVDLGKAIVNTTNVGVSIRVLRGSLAIVGVQDSNGTLSYNQGSTAVATHAWYPLVTTVHSATAEVRVANPDATPATVHVAVNLGTFHVAVQSATIDPYSTGLVTITPNSAIPAAGYAALSLSSNVPVISALATGTGSWIVLNAPAPPANTYLVRNFSNLGFDAISATNTSSKTETLTITTLLGVGTLGHASTSHVTIGAGATLSLSRSTPGMTSSGAEAFLLSTPRASLVVGMTLPGPPAGVDVVVPLDGR